MGDRTYIACPTAMSSSNSRDMSNRGVTGREGKKKSQLGSQMTAQQRLLTSFFKRCQATHARSSIEGQPVLGLINALTGVDPDDNQIRPKCITASFASLFHGHEMSADCMADELRQLQAIETNMGLIGNLLERSKRRSKTWGKRAWELG